MPTGSPNPQKPKKVFAEFFAGIGLVGAGLEKSGWKCIYANDIDPKKHEIYVRNFPETGVYDERDIWETEVVVRNINRRPFLATASFPCVDLSLAGHCRGLDGKHSSAFFGFSKVLASMGEKLPCLVMIENVAGFLTSRAGGDFRRVCKELASLGYWLDAFVLDAKSFVPQSRPRVFIIGVHESIESPLLVRKSASLIGDPWLAAIDSESSIRPKSLVSIMRDTELQTGWVATEIRAPKQKVYQLEKLIDIDDHEPWWSPADTKKHFQMLSDRHRDTVNSHLRSNDEIVGTAYRRKRNGSTKLEVRFDNVAGCLRTPRGGSARQIVVHIRKGEFRLKWMSPREYARLQGAKNFKLLDNDRQMLFGFGDAVCVPVISWIDECVLTPLYETACVSRLNLTHLSS